MCLWALYEPRHLHRWTQQFHLPVQSTVCWYVLLTFPLCSNLNANRTTHMIIMKPLMVKVNKL